MGVNQLWSLVTPVGQHVHLKGLRGSLLAVDLSGWIVESNTCKGLKTTKKPHLRNLFFRVSALLHHGVQLVFVLEGAVPDLKQETMAARQNSRQQYGPKASSKSNKAERVGRKNDRSNHQNHISECRELLNAMGVPCIDSAGEAEAMCAFLNHKGIVDGCITDDGDAFLYGAQVVYRNITIDVKDPHVDCYRMADIEGQLGLDRHKLIALSILLGCDYFPKGVPGIGKETALKLFEKLDGCDVLDRFNDWVTNPKYETFPSKEKFMKPKHCSFCGHIGSLRNHKVSGCTSCGTDRQCDSGRKSIGCDCDWHDQLKAAEDVELELSIRSKALLVKGFSSKVVQVVKEYKTNNNVIPEEELIWKKPKHHEFLIFVTNKLGWTEDYSLEKLFPLLTRWQMMNMDTEDGFLAPQRILKHRTRKGISSLEVEWCHSEISNDDRYIMTVEAVELFKGAFPELYDRFCQQGKSKKIKKKQDKPETVNSMAFSPCSVVLTKLPELWTADNDVSVLESSFTLIKNKRDQDTSISSANIETIGSDELMFPSRLNTSISDLNDSISDEEILPLVMRMKKGSRPRATTRHESKATTLPASPLASNGQLDDPVHPKISQESSIIIISDDDTPISKRKVPTRHDNRKDPAMTGSQPEILERLDKGVVENSPLPLNKRLKKIHGRTNE